MPTNRFYQSDEHMHKALSLLAKIRAQIYIYYSNIYCEFVAPK